jgi:hypothetical protein
MRRFVLTFAVLFSAALPAEAKQDSTGIVYEPIDDIAKAAAQDGRPIVYAFGALWCNACREFRRKTLPHADVQSVGAAFHWTYNDIDRNVQLARDFGIQASPQFIVFSPGGVRIGELEGYVGPDDFVTFLNRCLILSEEAEANLSFESILSISETLTPLTFSADGYRGQSICFSHVGYGPMRLTSQAPGTIIRPTMEPRVPSTLLRNQWELTWTESLANIWSYRENDYRLDYGSLNSQVALARGLTDTLQVEIAFRDVSRFGSVLDPVSDAFHGIFGIDDAGRDDFPSGDNAFFLAAQGPLAEIDNDDSGSLSRDLELTLQNNITCGTRVMPALAVSATGRYHLGGEADLTGSSDWSLNLSASASRQFMNDFYVYFGIGHTWHGLDQFETLPLNRTQWSGLLAFEWRYEAREALVLQLLNTEGASDVRAPFDDPSYEIDLGWKREVTDGTVIEIGIIENIIAADSSPDFGLHFGLRHRF